MSVIKQIPKNLRWFAGVGILLLVAAGIFVLLRKNYQTPHQSSAPTTPSTAQFGAPAATAPTPQSTQTVKPPEQTSKKTPDSHSTASNNTPSPTSSTAPPATPPSAQIVYGVTNEAILTPSGSFSASHSNQIIENLDITGRLSIPDGIQNVIIRNCRFTGDGSEWFAIDTQGSGSVTIDHVTIRGTYNDAFIAYNNITMTNSDMYGMSNDAVKLGNNVVYKHNYIHDFRPGMGSHADGMQIFEKVGNVLVQDNIISGLCDPTYQCVFDPDNVHDKIVNSAMILSDSTGTGNPGGTVTITGNTLSGGGYTLYFTLPNVNTIFTNNRFVRNTAMWGPIEETSWATIWSGNTFSDNGQTVTMPGAPR